MTAGDSKRVSPADDATAAALKKFHAPSIEEVWAKAIARHNTDPKGAITSARELLESVCKHILDDAGITHDQIHVLNQLYYMAAQDLEIAPNQQTDYDFRRILGACATIVESVGNLRSDIGDAHGKGKDAATVETRHALLAVTLAGAMATYLISIWETKQTTIGNVIRRFIEDKSREGRPPDYLRFSLEAVLRQPIANVAATRITARHVMEYAQARLNAGAQPPTIRQDLTNIKRTFQMARTSWGIEAPMLAMTQAWPILREKKLISSSTQRERRPTSEEIESLLTFFRERDKISDIQMAPVIEFTLETARHRGEVCQLRWEDLDSERRTYKILGHKPGRARVPRDREFELSDKAWTIIESMPKVDERIFPYLSESIGKRFIEAVKALKIKDLEFRDIRFEALLRMFESGLTTHEVQKRTGMRDPITLQRHFEKHGKERNPRPPA